jgi:hypothetical protein
MQKEIWKDVLGFENYYKVSNLGNVFSKINNRNLSITTNSRGYCQVMLCGSIQRKNKRVHILVCESFKENIFNKPFVNHINGIRNDNNIENLEWCTHLENVTHAISTGLFNPRKKRIINESKRFRKVVKISTNEIYKSISECARQNNINKKTLNNKLLRNDNREYKYFI